MAARGNLVPQDQLRRAATVRGDTVYRIEIAWINPGEYKGNLQRLSCDRPLTPEEMGEFIRKENPELADRILTGLRSD